MESVCQERSVGSLLADRFHALPGGLDLRKSRAGEPGSEQFEVEGMPIIGDGGILEILQPGKGAFKAYHQADLNFAVRIRDIHHAFSLGRDGHHGP
jgi:hypothetical protein